MVRILFQKPFLCLYSPQVSELGEFEGAFQRDGLQHWQVMLSASQATSATQDPHSSFNMISEMERNPQLRASVLGDDRVILTPCQMPPSVKTVTKWLHCKQFLKKAKSLKQILDLTPIKFKAVKPGTSSSEKIPPKVQQPQLFKTSEPKHDVQMDVKSSEVYEERLGKCESGKVTVQDVYSKPEIATLDEEKLIKQVTPEKVSEAVGGRKEVGSVPERADEDDDDEEEDRDSGSVDSGLDTTAIDSDIESITEPVITDISPASSPPPPPPPPPRVAQYGGESTVDISPPHGGESIVDISPPHGEESIVDISPPHGGESIVDISPPSSPPPPPPPPRVPERDREFVIDISPPPPLQEAEHYGEPIIDISPPTSPPPPRVAEHGGESFVDISPPSSPPPPPLPRVAESVTDISPPTSPPPPPPPRVAQHDNESVTDISPPSSPPPPPPPRVASDGGESISTEVVSETPAALLQESRETHAKEDIESVKYTQGRSGDSQINISVPQEKGAAPSVSVPLPHRKEVAGKLDVTPTGGANLCGESEDRESQVRALDLSCSPSVAAAEEERVNQEILRDPLGSQESRGDKEDEEEEEDKALDLSQSSVGGSTSLVTSPVLSSPIKVVYWKRTLSQEGAQEAKYEKDVTSPTTPKSHRPKLSRWDQKVPTVTPRALELPETPPTHHSTPVRKGARDDTGTHLVGMTPIPHSKTPTPMDSEHHSTPVRKGAREDTGTHLEGMTPIPHSKTPTPMDSEQEKDEPQAITPAIEERRVEESDGDLASPVASAAVARRGLEESYTDATPSTSKGGLTNFLRRQSTDVQASLRRVLLDSQLKVSSEC